jgi:hypothetical protein
MIVANKIFLPPLSFSHLFRSRAYYMYTYGTWNKNSKKPDSLAGIEICFTAQSPCQLMQGKRLLPFPFVILLSV